MRVYGDGGLDFAIAKDLQQALLLGQTKLSELLERQLGLLKIGQAAKIQRLGRRRCSGIWPPSKPRIRLEPEREPCPL